MTDSQDHHAITRIQPAAGHMGPQQWLHVAELAAATPAQQLRLAVFSALELEDLPASMSPDTDLLAHTQAQVIAPALSSRARGLARETAMALRQHHPNCRARVAIGDDSAPAPLLPTADVHASFDAAAADIVAQAASTSPSLPEAAPSSGLPRERAEEAIGWLPDPANPERVSLGCVLQDGLMAAAYAEMIGRMEVDTTITAWGGLVFHDLAEADADVVLRFLAPRGFIFDENSPLLG